VCVCVCVCLCVCVCVRHGNVVRLLAKYIDELTDEQVEQLDIPQCTPLVYTLRRSDLRCSVLQCVAVCSSVLPCVAVCCSVLQCVYALTSGVSDMTHVTHSSVHVPLLPLCPP